MDISVILEQTTQYDEDDDFRRTVLRRAETMNHIKEVNDENEMIDEIDGNIDNSADQALTDDELRAPDNGATDNVIDEEVSASENVADEEEAYQKKM